MGFFAPIIFSVVLLGFLALFGSQAGITTPNAMQQRDQADGELFLAYRNVILSYVESYADENHFISGSVPTQFITRSGIQFSPDFLSQVGNVVVPTGERNGRFIVCWGALSPKAMPWAAKSAEGDASFGVALEPSSSGDGRWISLAPGSTNQIMTMMGVPIRAGMIVSVVRMDR